MRFESYLEPKYPEADEDMWFIYKDGKLMVKSNEEGIDLIRYKDIKKMNLDLDYVQCMGGLDRINCFYAELRDASPSEGIKFMDLRSLMFFLDEDTFSIAAKGLLLLNWEKNNKFCGKCGFKMVRKESHTERALICPKCGFTTWPRTSPAIIVAVTKGDKLLLGHNKGFDEGMYSVIAGFVEMGENFEKCVKREVFEETGIKIKNIKYFGNQPWPFPNSMMIGFTAEYLEGEIKVDGEEITHADWFTKNEIPKYKVSKSIGSSLIEWFIKTH